MIERTFKDDLEAISYTFKRQKDRRRVTDADLLRAIEAVDKLRAKGGNHNGGRPSESYTNNKEVTGQKSIPPFGGIEKKESAKETAKVLGLSSRQVDRARAVNKNKDAKAQVQNGKVTLNKAYTQVRKEEKVKKEAKKEQESFTLTADTPAPLVQVAKLPPLETRGLYIPTPAEIEYLRLDKKQKFNEQKNSDIEWAMWSWNPVTGCNHGCRYCYAHVIALGIYEQKFVPTFIPERLGVAPTRVWVQCAERPQSPESTRRAHAGVGSMEKETMQEVLRTSRPRGCGFNVIKNLLSDGYHGGQLISRAPAGGDEIPFFRCPDCPHVVAPTRAETRCLRGTCLWMAPAGDCHKWSYKGGVQQGSIGAGFKRNQPVALACQRLEWVLL